MGIYNRDYYRDSAGSRGVSWGLDGLTPVVKYLICANVVVFLLQIFIVRETSYLEMWRHINPKLYKVLTEKEENPEAYEKLKKKNPAIEKLERPDPEEDAGGLFQSQLPRVSIVQEWCELDTDKVVYQGQVWRLLTHAFCHDRQGIWHIVFNMLFLYWFGCTLESMYGSKEFLLFYLASAVAAALAYMGMDLYTGRSLPAIGASGAVMGVVMLYTMHFPYETIMVCWIIPVQMRWLLLFYVIFDLHPVLLALSGDQVFTGIAHAAHLGGLAFGFLYARYQWRLEPLADRISLPSRRWRRRPRLRLAAETFPDPEPRPANEDDRLDELLQKIYESGQASLTDDERALLRQASERLKNRASRDL